MKRSKAILGLALATALVLAACQGGGGSNNGGSANPSVSPSASASAVAKTTFKLAFNQTERHPEFIAAENFGKKLMEQTDGRYSIEVYPNELLGSQNEVVETVSSGTVEMMFISGAVLERLNPDFAVFDLPYMFDSPEAQEKVLTDTAVTEPLFTSLEDPKAITVLAGLYGGVRNIYNTKGPIKTPSDLAGLKIRVQQSDSQTQMLSAMGGTAVPMAQGDVYAALQSGVLAGAENNETVFDALKHDEVAKYYSYTRHLMIPDYLIMNADVLRKMDPADKEIFLKLAEQCRVEANEGFKNFVAESVKKAEALGVKFNDDVDIAAFKKVLEPLKAKFIKSVEQKKLAAAVADANAAVKK